MANETRTITETITTSVNDALPTAMIEVITETVDTEISYSGLSISHTKNLQDSVALLDIFSFISGVPHSKGILDILLFEDETFGYISGPDKKVYINETWGISDNIKNNIIKEILDNYAISDLIEATLFVTKKIWETLTVYDTMSKDIEILREDTENVLEGVLPIRGRFLMASDSIALSESIEKTTGANREDVIALTEVIAKQVGINPSDLLALVEEYAFFRDIFTQLLLESEILTEIEFEIGD